VPIGFAANWGEVRIYSLDLFQSPKLSTVSSSDELVPTPWQRLDENRISRVVTKCVPDVENVALQHLRLNIGIRPDRVEKFILRHQPARMIHETSKKAIAVQHVISFLNPRRSPEVTHLYSDRLTHPEGPSRCPQNDGKQALSSPPEAGCVIPVNKPG